jgi:hypothetical protein
MNQNNLPPNESPDYESKNNENSLLDNTDLNSVDGVKENVQEIKKDKNNIKAKLPLFLLISVLILIIIVVIFYIKWNQKDSFDSDTNIIPPSSEIIPNNSNDETDSRRSYGSKRTLFLVTNERSTTKTTATVYDVDQNKVLETNEFTLPGDDIKDDYFGNHSSFNVNNGDVYISTFVSEIPQDNDDGPGSCYLSHIWGPGCQQSLYKVNMSDSSQQLLYQYKNAFAWILSPDNSKLFITEIDGSNLTIKTIDTETYQLSTLTTFSDLSDKFVLRRDLINPLFVNDDNKTLYMMFTRTLVEAEKWEEVIRKVEIDTQKTTDIVVKGINDRFAYFMTISPDAKKIGIGYADEVGDNDYINKIAIFDLTTNVTTYVPNVTIGNFTLVWGSSDSLYWANEDNKLSKYDLNTGQHTQSKNQQLDSRNVPLAASPDNKYLLLRNFDDKLLLYDFETENISDFLPELNLDIYEIKGVKWL